MGTVTVGAVELSQAETEVMLRLVDVLAAFKPETTIGHMGQALLSLGVPAGPQVLSEIPGVHKRDPVGDHLPAVLEAITAHGGQ